MKSVLTITTTARNRNTSRLLALSVVILLTGCGEKKHELQQAAPGPVAVVKGAVIETVKSALVPETVEVVGTVRARTSAVVSARIPGTVSVLRVREGDRIKKGQLLAQLDAQENQANAAVATAGIDEAQRALDESLSRKKLADTTFERYQRLFTEQAVTRQEFDVKQSERDLAHLGVARAEARLRQTREVSRAASAMSDYTRIVAPISGIITSKQADLGATVFPAQPLMTIEDEGSYQLELAIPESIASRIKTGSAVQISVDSQSAPFTTQIAELVPTADPGSRTFTAKINLNNKGLKSGMFGRGIITLGSSVTGMLVTRTAVVERGSLTSVWALDKDNVARMRLVKTGKTVGQRVEILSGLSDGERVVASGTEKVQEGSKVE
jgi:RND family efflux transporter MFP subunit